MKDVFYAELYGLRRDRLLWLVPVFYGVMGFYSGFYDHAVMDTYRGLELFIFTEIMNVFLPFAVVIVTSYVIGGDFSRHTIRNVLSVGVRKKSYYFSRLLVQGLVTGTLFAGTGLIHVVCHLVCSRADTDVQTAFLWQKLAVYMAVALLQLLAYVSVMNAVCYFVKNQLAALVLGIGMVYLELIIRQAASLNELVSLQHLLDFLPTIVIRNLFEYAVYDRIFTGEFLRYGLSAFLIIVGSSAVGFAKFYSSKSVL